MTNARRATTVLRSGDTGSRLRVNTPESSPEFFNPSLSVQTLQAATAHGVPHVLLLDRDSEHRQRLCQRLLGKDLAIETCLEVRDAVRKLREHAGRYDLVIVSVSDLSRPWDRILHALQEAAHHSRRHMGPLFLCTTKAKKLLQLRLTIEQMGARLAYER